MGNVIRLVGPNRAVEILGVKLVGVNAENGLKLLFTLGFIALVLLLGRGLQALTRRLLRGRGDERAAILGPPGGPARDDGVMLLMGLVSIWFDDPTRLTTALGLVTAGPGVRPPEGRHGGRRLLRHPAGQDVQRRRPDHDGRRPRRRDRAGVHPDDHHGDGPAAGGAERRPGDVGAEPPVHRAGSSPSPTPRSSTSRSTTTRATSPTSGRR